MMRISRSTSDKSPDNPSSLNRFALLATRCASCVIRRSNLLIKQNISRALSLTLVIALLTTSTPASSELFGGMSSGLKAASWEMWFHVNQWLSAMQAQLERKPEQETQTERDERAVRVEISPDNVTIGTGEQVIFAATAYDSEGQPIGGMRFKWLAEDAAKERKARISRTGVFMSKVAGDFRVTAEAAGRQAHVNVKVVNNAGGASPVDGKVPPGENPLSEKDVSTRDYVPPQTSSLKQEKPGASLTRNARSSKTWNGASYSHTTSTAPAVAAIPLEGEWNDNNYRSADDPFNRRGDPPDQVSGDNPGSGNFQIAAPVLELPGRGIDLQLRLTYNAALWNESGAEITYDIDQDWPAPGWSLGFGRLIRMGSSGSMIVDADGTRHGYNGTIANYSYGSSFTGYTTDSTFIDYSHWANASGTITSATAKQADGTIISYGAPGLNAVYPTRITDANGNYITITYVNNSGPKIQTVTDTLGRTINFHYDVNLRLTAITAPSMGISGGLRTLVRLHYRQLTLGYSFYGLTPRVRNPSPWVIDAIYYPATRTGYWFGDADSYSSYGMIAKVIGQRIMTLSSSSLSDHGTVSPGMMSTLKLYNFPMTSGVQLTHAPSYTTMTEDWSGNQSSTLVTTYTVQQNTSPRTMTIVQPDGTRNVQYSYNYSSLPENNPEKYKDGLTYQDEMYDAAGRLWRRSVVSWEKGDYGSLRPTRQENTDENGNVTAEGFLYGPKYNQVTVHLQYGFGPWNLRRETITEYDSSAAYINRHIFNLVKSVTVYDRDEITKIARTEYQYDGPGSSLSSTPDVIMHSDAYDPYDPQYWVEEYCYQVCNGYDPCYTHCEPGYWMNDYDPSTDYRGNLTRMVKYADAANLGGQVVETYGYDVTGNRVTTSGSCCELTKSNFGTDTQYAYSTSQSRGSLDPYSSVRVTSSSTYDFNTGLPLTATDANGRSSQVSYFSDSLRPLTTTLSTGASTTFTYDDNMMGVTETTKLANGTVLSTKTKRFDGRGLVIQEQSGADGVYDIVEIRYDESGRPVSQTRPYRSGQTKNWANTSYDVIGRATKVIAPDGISITENFYNETSRPPGASTEPGSTVRSVDAWGRERWERSDPAGNIVEVVEPNPSGTGSVFAAGALITRYNYNALGHLIEVLQGEQQRRFRYDSLGRMTHQKLAEANATLNDAGQYVGNGQWSHVFTYDERSNLIARVDPRGIRTVYNYNNDPLNRLQSVTYDTSGFGDTASPVLSASTVSYVYMSSGDIMRPFRVTAQGVSTEEFAYDAEARIIRKTLTLVSRPSYPMVVEYTYDTANRLTDTRYPTQYGTAAGNKLVHYDYDGASRPTAVKVNNAVYGSQLTYNASGQLLSMLVGASGANQLQETYLYDDKTGLISNQKVMRGTTALLDLTHFMYNSYARAGRTGQLSKLINNLNAEKTRIFTYDALGRLSKVTNNSTWSQNYTYDRYGNRRTVTSSNSIANLSPAPPQPQEFQLASHEPPRDASPARLRGETSHYVSNVSQASTLSHHPANTLTRMHDDDLRLESSERGAALNAPTQMPTPTTQATPAPPQTQQTDTTTAAPSGLIPICPERDPGCQPNMPPSANPGGPYNATPGQAIQFNGGNSYDDDGFITTYAWNFGDGTTGTGVSPTKTYASAGTYNVSLRVRDNAGAYSSFSWTTATVSNPIYNGATFVSQTVPTAMNAGHKYSVTVTMRNSGTRTWTAADMHRLGTQNPQDNNTWGLTRMNVPASVSPGSSVTFNYTVTAPSTSGTYNFQWRMVQDGVAWFGDSTPNVAVTVAQPTVGNCLSTNAPCDGIPTLSYDVGSNRINTPGWLYDAAGNQTRVQLGDGTWQRYQYDASGRLLKVKTDGGLTYVIYTYGAGGERLVKQEGGDNSNQRTYYVWDGNNIITEYIESNSSPTAPIWLKNYIFLGRRLLATQQPSGSVESVLYYHPDHLGTRLISNPLTGVVTEQTTLPFGTAFDAESTGTTNRRFTSYDRSTTTGLDYAINRHYDALQGRFTQPDPIGMKAATPADPQSLNLYSYCGNDPVNHLDPDGLFFGRLFKKIGSFFKAIGRAVSRVGTCLAKVLHNRWVMLGISIISLIAPPVWAIYQTASELTMILQTGGLLLQGKFKEFGMAVLAAVKQYVINKTVNWMLEKLEGVMYGMDIIKLTLCQRKMIGKYFKLSSRVLSNMRLHIGHPGFGRPLPSGYSSSALTWGNDVYLFGVQKNQMGYAWALDLTGHESIHTLEAKVLGQHMFMLSYAVGGLWSIAHGQWPHLPPNFLETPAYDADGVINAAFGRDAKLCPVTK